MSAADFYCVESLTHFNELLVALRAALPAEALQQLAQQAHTLLHLLDGTLTFGNFLHSLLVLQGEKGKVEIRQSIFIFYFNYFFSSIMINNILRAVSVSALITIIFTWFFKCKIINQ